MTPELLPVAQLTAMVIQTIEWHVTAWSRSFIKGFLIALCWVTFLYMAGLLFYFTGDYGLIVCMCFVKFTGTFLS